MQQQLWRESTLTTTWSSVHGWPAEHWLSVTIACMGLCGLRLVWSGEVQIDACDRAVTTRTPTEGPQRHGDNLPNLEELVTEARLEI